MITQTIYFQATPEKVYNALMIEKEHAKFTGAGAEIENKVGGKFSVWDGYSTGKNLELIPGKKIVQSWRASDWPEGIFSKVIFELTKQDNGTKLKFTHENIPPDCEKDIAKGWEDYYWNPLKNYLSNTK